MTSKDQMAVEIAAFENELARLAAEELTPDIEALVDKVSRNLAKMQADGTFKWYEVRAFIQGTRLGIYQTIAMGNIGRMVELGCEL